MISSERNKVQKGGKSSATANERKTAHLEQQSTQTELQKKICESLGVRVQHSEESGQQSETRY